MFIALDSIDHFFYHAATPEESYRLSTPAKGAPAREFNPVILETLRAWLDETAARAKKGPEKPSNESKLVGAGDRFAGIDAGFGRKDRPVSETASKGGKKDDGELKSSLPR